MFAKKRILKLLVATALSASMLLAGCTSTNAPSGNAGNNGNAGTDGSNGSTATKSKYPGSLEAGTAVIDISAEPADLCSFTSTDTVSGIVLIHAMDGLTILDQKDEPIPGVAKDWTISEDQLVYTFNLRDDYKWSNGEKVTAKDFEFAWKSLINPDFASDYAYFGYVIKDAKAFAEGKAKIEDVGIKVIDDYKLEVTLEQPTPYFLGMLAYKSFMPVNEKAYTEFGDKYGTDADKIVTNGPYKITSWSHESEIVLEKNADFPDAADIKVEKVVMKMIKDSNARMNAFKSNEIDLINVNSEQLLMIQGEGEPFYTYDDASCWYFEYNMKDPVLANQKVRQALTIAFDSESFVKNVVGNNSKVAKQFTPVAIKGNKKSFAEELGPQFEAHDIEKAKQLIEEAKTELGVDDITVSLLMDDGDTAAKHAAFVQEAWQKDLGITVKVEAVPFKSRLDRMSNKDFQIVMAGWGPDYNDPMTFLDMFETGNGNNHTGYSNSKYDDLLELAREEIDRDKRFGYLMDMEKLLMQDMPIGPYYFRSRDYITSAKVTGITRTAFQDTNLRWASLNS